MPANNNNNGRGRGGRGRGVVRGRGGQEMGQFRWPSPPFDGAEGRWVHRSEMPHGKSFGFYCCFNCDNSWTSAHAQAAYRQDCLSCRQGRYPLLMWKNSRRGGRDAGAGPAGKPHLARQCEACRRGVCRNA